MIQNSERFVYNNRVIPVLKVNQAFVLQSSDRCYYIHQPETAIAFLQRVLGKMREALAIPQGIALIVAEEGRGAKYKFRSLFSS